MAIHIVKKDFYSGKMPGNGRVKENRGVIMSDNLTAFNTYIHALERKLALGDATEHTHRSALEALIGNLSSAVTATNEPKHIECGAPDFIVRKGSVTVGYIEAKDIGKSLDEVEKSEQLNRYRG